MFNFFKRRKKKEEAPVETLLHKELSFAATEAYKLLRINLLFSLPDNGKCRVVGITSSIRGEGKSTTSINLSYALAMLGKKVLLLDADLRLPSVATKLGIPGEPGLSEMIIKLDGKCNNIREMPESENWHVLTSGSIPPNPSEMLGSPEMKGLVKELSEDYDFIIVDLPPVNIVSDALIVSEYLDGVIAVVRQDYSKRREVTKCVKQLELAGAKLLGFVMGGVGNSRRGYKKKSGYGYDGYHYGYGYGEYGRRRRDSESGVEPSEKSETKDA
jgi:capsular exopolysaccharide synthesis family protein